MPRVNPPSGPLERAILLSVVYADIFDHSLTLEELLHYLVEATEPGPMQAAVEGLVAAGWLECRDGVVVWRGRGELASLRFGRRERSSVLWQQARDVANRLARVPFLRMVGVCGSLAVENVPEGGDIDLFLVTESSRLWIVQRLAMGHRRRALRQGMNICPNYLLTLENLEVRRQNLYTAREIAQVVPLWGESTYDRFLAANGWIYDFLPNLDLADRRRFLESEPRPKSRIERWEGVLGGRLGGAVDRSLHRLLVAYYPWRLRSRGVRGEQVREAYRRDRQEVVGGGYSSAIRERFLARVRQWLGEEAATYAGRRFFPPSESRSDSVPLYGQQLAERYGIQG